MKTAEEILKQYYSDMSLSYTNDCIHGSAKQAIKAMKEYARQAVEVALEDAAENAKCIVMQAQDDSVMAIISHNSILNRKEEIFKKLGI